MASVDIYSFPITNNEYRINGINLVNFLGSILDSNIVENINYDVLPDWVSNKLDIGTTHRILNFSYHNVDFCIICYSKPSSSAILVDMVGKNANGYILSMRIEQIHSASPSTINFLIGQDIDYFLFYYLGSVDFYFGVFRIDAPTNANDTDVYISAFDKYNICYTKPFRNEDYFTRIYFASDIPYPYPGVAPYDDAFTKNFYNNKIPVYNVYAYNRVYGTRGKLTNLIVLPNPYSLSPSNFYMVNGNKYCAFGTLGITNAGTVLVRVK
jgi:hypothetical protein